MTNQKEQDLVEPNESQFTVTPLHYRKLFCPWISKNDIDYLLNRESNTLIELDYVRGLLTHYIECMFYA